MIIEYETMKNRIVEILDKNKIHNDDYLAIKRELKKMEKRYINTCETLNENIGELEQQTHNAKYWKSTCENISKLPFKEKIKILFKK